MIRRLAICILLCTTYFLATPIRSTSTPESDTLFQQPHPKAGVASNSVRIGSAAATRSKKPQTTISPVRFTTAKSLRQQDFSPIIETALFSASDYSVYGWVDFLTSASSATVMLRWKWTQPDGTSFEEVSPWWNFGSEGKAAAWLQLQTGNFQTGRWQVTYYAMPSDGTDWQYLGTNTFFVNPRLPCAQFQSNGGFENGSANWQISNNTYIGTGKPHWGNQSAWLGGADNGYYFLYQDVTLPAAAPGELSLAYYYNLFTEESNQGAYDFFNVQIRDTAGNLLETLDTLNNQTYYSRDPQDLWQPITWDLSAYAGSTIRLWLTVQTDSSLPTTFYLDDFIVSKCRTSRPLAVNVILAEPTDVTHNAQHNHSYYENLVNQVSAYHVENTMGYVNLQLMNIYDNGGSWYKLTKTMAEYAGNPLSFVREAEQQALGTTVIPSDSIVVVVHAGDSAQSPHGNASDISTQTWESPTSPNGNEVIASESEAVGGVAHEIGHDLGSLLVSSATPDVYKMGNVGRWDLMATGSWNGGILCGSPWINICDGSNPPNMSSYTKEFLQLLSYQRVDRGSGGTYWVDALPRKQLGDSVLQYVVSQRNDGTPDKYYIMETRNSSSAYSRWDTSVPQSGLVIYWVDTKGKPKYGDYASNISQRINQVAVLQAPGFLRKSEFVDLENMLHVNVVEEKAQGTSDSLKVEISAAAPDPLWLAGVVLRPDGKVADDLAPWQGDATPPDGDWLQPDLDLHVYTSDGRHVGMNYATGQYENQVPGALTSGNLVNAHEWILMPQGISFNYYVRSTATSRFLQQNPTASNYTDGVDGYEVYGLISNPASGFYTSTLQHTSISAGTDMAHAVTIDSGQNQIQVGSPVPTVLPVDLGVSTSAPALVAAGDVITYAFKFGNSGGTAATGVYLQAHVPDGTDLVTAPGFSSIGNNLYRFPVTTLSAGAGVQAVMVVKTQTNLSANAPVTMQATAGDDGSHGPDQVPSNNSVSVVSHIAARIFLPMIEKGN